MNVFQDKSPKLSRFQPRKNLKSLNSRRSRWITLGVACLALVLLYRFWPRREIVTCKECSEGGCPPDYTGLKLYEENLPQHNLDLPAPEGRTGKYIRFDNQIRQLGWNNVLIEIMLCAQLAYASGRGYVFEDYTWKREYYHWQDLVKARGPWYMWKTPLNALLSGPMAGGPWPDKDDSTPRSISVQYWEKVCPAEDRERLSSTEMKEPVKEADGIDVFNHWKKRIQESPKRCIEVYDGGNDGYPQTFDLWLVGWHRFKSLWPMMKTSPVVRGWGPSHIVNTAILQNIHLFHPKEDERHTAPENPLWARTMAVHIRKGDFEEACQSLARWNSTYFGYNQFNFLPDGFTPPGGGAWGENTPKNIEFYMHYCLPTEEETIKKINSARDHFLKESKTSTTLDTLYIMSNGDAQWLAQYTEKVKKHGWKTVASSIDLKLNTEGRDVDMAVDMHIGRLAAVFIGNGWSSFTSTIVHTRLVDDKIPISQRFWGPDGW